MTGQVAEDQTPILRRIEPAEVQALRRDPVDEQTLEQAGTIVKAVRDGGTAALRKYAEQFGDIQPEKPLVYTREDLAAALAGLSAEDRALLERTATRIREFATKQRSCLQDLVTAVGGCHAGHTVCPMNTAGCYAPGGRFPLPSSVLMTAVTARTAGVQTVWVASPRPTQLTLAAAAVADADALLGVGGAQAIAALAYGTDEVPACDAIVGPGNRWVTAAKQIVSGRVAIDMLAGPSELVVLADDTANAETVAADLIAQAEHDVDAMPVLVTTEAAFVDAVDAQVRRQLNDLPTAQTARPAFANGYAVVAENLEQAVTLCDRIAPEHLQLHVKNPDELIGRLQHYGALFIGEGAAEVFADYGAGPNHVLPTGGTARSVGGLSVLTFLRVRTWLRGGVHCSGDLAADAASLARHEGLEGHARAAERRQ